MSAPVTTPPPAPDSFPHYVPTPRQRTTIYLTCTLLFLSAIMLFCVPSARLPLPARLAIGIMNLIAAATLALIVRQKSNPPPMPPAGQSK